MIRSVKLVGSMCLFVFTLCVQAQEIQPKGNQPDSLMNQVTLSASDNDGFYNQYMNNIVPNSPTVSELMKYVDQPVDLFHGMRGTLSSYYIELSRWWNKSGSNCDLGGTWLEFECRWCLYC